jgi:hypothetical protein
MPDDSAPVALTQVPAARWPLFPTMLCVLLGVFAAARADVKHLQSDEATEIAYLVRRGTADSLATASLLAHLTQVSDEERAPGAPAPPDPSQLIGRAISMAPNRPELVWLQLRDCESRRCGDEAQIAARLKEIDADNGLAWLGDRNAAQSKSPEDVTQAIERMGAAPAPRVYWNRLTVMMFDALTHHDRTEPPTAITQHADDRLMHVTGVLAAVDVPAFRPLAYACRPEEFAATGRRAACEKAMARLEASDAVVTHLVRLSVLEAWWPASTPEGAALRLERSQRRYLTVASNRLRKGRADSDAETRVGAMRHLQSEEDVERAMLTAFHEPLERPADWRSPGAAQ